MSINWSRRDFLNFMGTSVLVGCAQPSKSTTLAQLSPSLEDQFRVLDGFKYQIFISWGEVINSKQEKFGFNNDFIAFVPESKTEGWLWVNHEYPDSVFILGKSHPQNLEEVQEEQKNVGGSILKIRYENQTWRWLPLHADNRRIDGRTPIPMIADREIAGSKIAIGSFGNCAGGITPWATILSCEENYHDYYGERESEVEALPRDSTRHWAKFVQFPPEHYGWVVEVNPRTGEAKKLTALGRFAHESATVVQAADGRCVVYSGDDEEDECLYKFIADKTGSLEKGKLYVADLEKGRWLALDYVSSEILRKNFKDQTDVLIHARRAAHLLGASRLHRPEDIEVHPQTKDVYVSLTNHLKKLDFHGSLLRLQEENADPLSLRFSSSTFLMGGDENGFSCPDNLCFDPYGNLWMTTDMSGGRIGKIPYSSFGNNSLFLIPMKGPYAGTPIRVASGPVGSEITGPCFTPDGRHLFLSIQHPGEKSKSIQEATSHWPGQPGEIPRPSVVCVEVPFEKLKKAYAFA